MDAGDPLEIFKGVDCALSLCSVYQLTERCGLETEDKVR
jgi:hypothetical protein